MSQQQRQFLIRVTDHVERIPVGLVDLLDHTVASLAWAVQLIFADAIGARRPRHLRHKW